MKKYRLIAGALKGAVVALSLIASPAFAQETVTIGALHDLSGNLNIYGIQQSKALHLAVEQINENGGVNGKTVKVVEYDTQSSISKYTQYATTLILRDQVKAIFGGLASSAREAVRPIVHRNRIPYFYSALYEGGVCDRYTFLTGVTPSQQLGVLMKWAVENIGRKFYIVAPNYNFGTISAHWIHHYAEKYGGEVVGEDFLPLSQSNFGAVIQKIQSANPDVVVALPVGASQTSFYEQFAATGLKDDIRIISTNYGSGNQQVIVSPRAGKGIIASQGYFMAVSGPMNEKFKTLWREKYGPIEEPIISEARNTWNGVMLWAKAAKKVGSTDPEAVIDALEDGISLKAPGGKVKTLPSNHLMQQIYIARGNDEHGFEIVKHFKNVMPSYEQKVCNLSDNPEVSNQFTPDS